MINGYIENTKLPWEERIGNAIRKTTGHTIEDYTVKNERIDANTLVSTLIKDGKPDIIDTYITDTRGRLKKMILPDLKVGVSD